MSEAKRLLEQAREHDAALFYCDKCGSRYYRGSKGDVHDRSSEECRPGGCLAPEDHHPFIEGPLPDYEEAAVDRRHLIRDVLPDYEAAVDALESMLDAFVPVDSDSDDVLTARAALHRLRDEVPA